MPADAQDKKQTILAVDDAPENLDVVKNILLPEYNVKATVKGAIALKIAEADPPDLILLDVMMPEMDGYEVCRQLKANPITKEIPVIFLTAKDQTLDEAKGFDLGAADYIHKPVNPVILDARVRTHLALKASMDQLQTAYHTIRAQNARMWEELNIGRDIQISLLPLPADASGRDEGYDLWASLTSARELGGDFYDFYALDEDRICFCIGDVSGKGVPSALFMAVAKTLIKITAAEELSPARIMVAVNEELRRGNTSAMFVTIFLGVLDIRSGRLTYANGGHNPPFVLTASGQLTRLDERHGPALGVLPVNAYKESTRMLSPGDTVFTFTDGISEAFDRNDALFSEERLSDLLDKRQTQNPKILIDEVLRAVEQFAEGVEQSDDITALAMQFEGPAAGMDSVLSMSVANRPEEIAQVQEKLEGFAAQNRIAETDGQRVGMVLDELLSNIILYAHADEMEHQVEVTIQLFEKELSIRIEDDGIPFNPFNREPPDTSIPPENREIGGLGIHLVSQVMDSYSYDRRRQRNIVRLNKLLNS